MEMSNHPEQALRSADLLSTMAPDAGHLIHMPGHIYALCGDYEKAKIVSEQSIRADDMYADYAGSFNFYVTARGHDLHLMMHTCMFRGQYFPALAAADKIRAIMTEDILTMKLPSEARRDDGSLLRDEDARARPVRALARDHRGADAGAIRRSTGLDPDASLCARHRLRDAQGPCRR